MIRWVSMSRLSHSMKRRGLSRATQGATARTSRESTRAWAGVSEARQMLKRLGDRSADVYAALGDKDAAFRLLFKSVDERITWPIFIKADPLFESSSFRSTLDRTAPPHEPSDRQRCKRVPLAILCTLLEERRSWDRRACARASAAALCDRTERRRLQALGSAASHASRHTLLSARGSCAQPSSFR